MEFVAGHVMIIRCHEFNDTHHVKMSFGLLLLFTGLKVPNGLLELPCAAK